eukprot:8161058-Alexandrium_andersonii.AAC.1
MSASLVGSEMCIRDRFPARYRQAALHYQPWRAEACIRNRTARARRVHPVSYTHLTLPTICSV